MLDFRGLLFAPIYTTFGVPAELVLSDGTSYTLTAIDLTVGAGLSGPSELETLNPRALIMEGDLLDAGGVMDNLVYGTLALNSVTWRITSFRRLWTPNGEGQGELELSLENEQAVDG